jgi:hypothetical protein
MGITRAERCFKFGDHQTEASRQTHAFHQLTETRAILAVGMARFHWSRHSRMVGHDGVGRCRACAMVFRLEDLFDGIIANGK